MSTPEFRIDRAQALAVITAEIARRSGSRSFEAFVKQAWQYVPLVDPLVWGWHLSTICSHLEEVGRGAIPKLLVNCPPGMAKSVIVSVLWPAWIWTWWPKCQFLFGSYSAEFSMRDSMRCRAVVESEWYRMSYSGPAGWTLRADQNTKHWFINTVGGERMAVGVGGTGRRAHVIGIDDPIDATKIHSKAERETVNGWIGQTLSQRFVDARQPRTVMIMQRLHEEDPSAFVLSGGDWEHLRLPAEYDSTRICVTHRVAANRERQVFWRDPRTRPGELLFPERFPRDVLDRFKLPNALGIDGYEAQQNQNPTPPAGGMYAKAHWRFWTSGAQPQDWRNIRPPGCDQDRASMQLPVLDKVVLSVDAAFKDNPSGSQVAIHIWARAGGDFFLLYRKTSHMDFATTKDEIRKALATRFGQMVGFKLIEDAANGPAIISDLRHEIPGFIAVPPEGGKESRAAAVQPYQRSGNCHLPEGDPQNDEFVSLVGAFPKGKLKDDVDAMAQALRHLTQPLDAEQGSINWGRR